MKNPRKHHEINLQATPQWNQKESLEAPIHARWKSRNSVAMQVPRHARDLNSTTTIVNPEDIPNEMPGFSFVKGQCNPCSAFDGDFSCPFRLKTGEDDNSISEPWKQLWNL